MNCLFHWYGEHAGIGPTLWPHICNNLYWFHQIQLVFSEQDTYLAICTHHIYWDWYHVKKYISFDVVEMNSLIIMIISLIHNILSIQNTISQRVLLILWQTQGHGVLVSKVCSHWIEVPLLWYEWPNINFQKLLSLILPHSICAPLIFFHSGDVNSLGSCDAYMRQ